MYTKVLFIALLISLTALAERPGAKKKKAQNFHIDPNLKSIEGPLSFDENTKKALEKSKKPGVLIALEEEPGKIYQIEIIGAKKVEADAVILRLLSKIGQEYNELLIGEDINSIFSMGFFQDIKVYKNVKPSGAIELQYVLSEIPTIFQIKLEGNTLSENEIKDAISFLAEYQGANIGRIKDAAQKITDFYVSKGYYLAKVDFFINKTSLEDIKKKEADETNVVDTTTVAPPDFVDVVFRITENKKVYIDRISITGNKYLKEDSIKAQLRSQEKHLLSVISDWGTFRKEFLEIDSLIIEKMLFDNGFLMGKVHEPQIELSPDKSRVSIHHHITEGDQYFLGSVSLYGDLVADAEKPDEELITLKKGEIFNKSKFASDILSLVERYRDYGFAYVNVIPNPYFDEEKNTVDIDINIESGPVVFIERIEIVGNDKTKDEVIRRELKVDEGDQYSSTLLKISEQNVRRLGYFESVEFITTQGSTPDKILLKISVTEKSTTNIQAGGGYGTGGEGFVFRLQFTSYNLFGRGQAFSAKLDISSTRRFIDVSFMEPYLTYLFDNPVTFAFTLFNRHIFFGDYSKDSTGGDITFGYPIGGPLVKYSRHWQKNASLSSLPYVLDFDALWFYLTYTAERIDIKDVSEDMSLWDLHQNEPRYTTSLRPTIRLDQRDNHLFPERGYFVEFRAEFASSFFGSQALAHLENTLRNNSRKDRLSDGLLYKKPDANVNNFFRFSSNWRYYYSFDDWFFLKGVVLKTNLEIGYLNTFGKPLIFENYALGGMNNLRGYAHRSVAPIAKVASARADEPRKELAIGGNKQFFANIELEFPLIKPMRLSGVIFADVGNVFSEGDNWFYLGKKSANASRIHPSDPLKIHSLLGLYSSVGLGIRWAGPFGLLRFEGAFPLNRRPKGTPGMIKGDEPFIFEISAGANF